MSQQRLLYDVSTQLLGHSIGNVLQLVSQRLGRGLLNKIANQRAYRSNRDAFEFINLWPKLFN